MAHGGVAHPLELRSPPRPGPSYNWSWGKGWLNNRMNTAHTAAAAAVIELGNALVEAQELVDVHPVRPPSQHHW